MAIIRKIGNHKVGHIKVAVRKAGDGLSESIAANGVDTVELGGSYYILMQVDVKGGAFKLDKDDPRQVDVSFNLDAGVVTFVDKDLAQPIVQEQADRNEEARIAAEEAKGTHRLEFAEPKELEAGDNGE